MHFLKGRIIAFYRGACPNPHGLQMVGPEVKSKVWLPPSTQPGWPVTS